MKREVPAGNQYPKFSTANPIVRRLVAAFVDRAAWLVGRGPGRTVLDVGCGAGEMWRELAARLPEQRLTVVDIHRGEVVQARATLACRRAIAARAEALPFPDAAFDLVTGFEMLEHAADPDAALAEMLRVTRERILVSVPREPLWRLLNLVRGAYVADWGNSPGHLHHWSARAFGRFVGRRALVERIACPLPWTMVLARKRNLE